MPETTKVWYKSKGMWAGILTVVFGIYAVVQAQFGLFDITAYLPIIFTVLGAVGVYGRKEATGKIVFTDKPSN